MKHVAISCVVLLLFSCKQVEKKGETIVDTGNPHETVHYPITSVNIQQVKLHDKFWLPIIKRVQEETIDFALEKCEEEGRFENFLIAGGELEGEVRGAMPFDDTDVYKIIEGASNSLISAPNPQLEQLLNSLVTIVGKGQEKDGYLTTWRTINPAKPPATWVNVKEGKRWESLEMSHELYNAGHLFEAAAVHFQATGKRNFLNIALKNADLMVQTFGSGEGKIETVPGHQIIETGLLKLYQLTGKESYKDLAKFFLDQRGIENGRKMFGAYAQDHLPVTQQDEVVGHAVRAVYMYAAMTDVAALMNDSLYRKAVDDLWNNMVSKKMYLTGGIGARHEGEAFGENYELPNLTAYNETCASIGDVYWNHRLHNLTGEVKYFDVIERTLYNGLISGLSLDGKKFFYPNALESDGVYKFNQGSCTRKAWFDCSCCPSNLIRFIPSIPSLMYSQQKDVVYVNLYAASDAHLEVAGQKVVFTQETAYPWKGDINLKLNMEGSTEFIVKLRVPGWERNEVLPSDLYNYEDVMDNAVTLKINGEAQDVVIENGYITLEKTWKPNDALEINFPMQVRTVKANDNVEEDRGKRALEYGPIVYAVEEIDNKNNFDDIHLQDNETFEIKERPNLLGGVNTISNGSFTAIPYYVWSNRGVGKMKVWLPKSE
ncbi:MULTISPECIES: glycoside hydrolase family 127 protein [Flavobacteriaceae]|uniref:glycoside hydrolase family 127 protein n=1 Tax=Flavobacteriaceae TaxID=49546 RepID=UPI001490AA41|nr:MULTISPECIES: beta-L-arabinofuranosidase domain-containing protein [Allomuricauda]MDC6365883.1 glycoside hydrolase family 127 protein [Muricauda sp. AC10]